MCMVSLSIAQIEPKTRITCLPYYPVKAHQKPTPNTSTYHYKLNLQLHPSGRPAPKPKNCYTFEVHQRSRLLVCFHKIHSTKPDIDACSSQTVDLWFCVSAAEPSWRSWILYRLVNHNHKRYPENTSSC